MQMYRRLTARGYVPYLAQPRPLANAVRALCGQRQYRAVAGWLPPQPKAV
jgi:hypothetical protein